MHSTSHSCAYVFDRSDKASTHLSCLALRRLGLRLFLLLHRQRSVVVGDELSQASRQNSAWLRVQPWFSLCNSTSIGGFVLSSLPDHLRLITR